ncbi:MAG: DUF2141 domain-containing protein [Scytonema sp. PMC 1069.18]|nr:DUF2141 domain-containing protein [Scytonema sp. PMC 1069.18]MEC4887342.1 DUF2141 domain-containing protein [Scytonema sp. PMC 1070.18]
MNKSNSWHPLDNSKEISLKKCLVSALVFLGLGNIGLPSFAVIKQNSQLTVEIEGLRNQKGQVCLSLFASSTGFPDNATKAVENRCVAITAKTLSVTFQNLRPGSYAVAVLHDVNRDNTANRNGLGIPLEGFGFSENPVILTSPPRFNDAAVLVAGSNTNIQIRLNYLLGG